MERRFATRSFAWIQTLSGDEFIFVSPELEEKFTRQANKVDLSLLFQDDVDGPMVCTAVIPR